jgi:ascorbate PTS system EIIB component
MLKVVAACGSGMGSSLIIKMKISNVLKKLNIPADVGHTSVSDAIGQANNYDVIFCSDSLVGSFRANGKTKIIGLKNLLSEQEMEAKIKEAGLR